MVNDELEVIIYWPFMENWVAHVFAKGRGCLDGQVDSMCLHLIRFAIGREEDS